MPQPIVRGNIITVSANYRDATGALVTPDNPLVDIVDALGVTVLNNQVPTETSTGHYEYAYLVPADAALGAWAGVFSGTIDGDSVEAPDTFTVVAESGTAAAVAGGQTCTPWATHEDACSPCDAYGIDPDDLDDAMQVASDVLFNLTGRKYAGACTETVWPQAQWRQRISNWPLDWQALPRFAFCACHLGRDTGCAGVSEIRLPGYPVNPDAITVTIDGDAFVDFTLDDHRYLRRTDGSSWPCCNSFEEVDGWSITYQYGQAPPIGGVKAAAVLGCHLALAYNPDLIDNGADRCKLPERVTQVVRQGVTLTMLDPETLFEKGETGIASVDLWLQSERLGNARRRASIVRPWKHRGVRRVGQ